MTQRTKIMKKKRKKIPERASDSRERTRGRRGERRHTPGAKGSKGGERTKEEEETSDFY